MNTVDNYLEYDAYMTQLSNLDSGVDILLGQFKKLYVLTNMNSSNIEYKQQFKTALDNLAEILSKLYSISNDVDVNIANISSELLKYNVLIKKERDYNKELTKKIRITQNKSDSATTLINDYTDIYDEKYLRNWSIVLCIVVCLTSINILYKKNNI